MRLFTMTLLAAAALTVVGTAPAFAADTTTFNVTITILDTCDVDAAAATDVDFGDVESTAIDSQAIGSLSVRCTPLTPYDIALNEGQNGIDVNDRAMINGAIEVPYQLYQDAGRSVVWGETLDTNTYAGTGTGIVQVISVYGEVPSASFPAATYNDVVTATIVY